MSYVPDSVYDQIEDLKKKGDYEEALKMVNNILVKDPVNEQALFQVADIEYLKGEISNAEKPVDFILKYKGNSDPMGFYVKGVLEMEKTNWQEAKKFLRKALEMLDYDNPEIMRCYGLSEYWSGNREKGIEFLKKAFEQNGNDAEIIYNLIEIHLLEHKYNLSKKYIKHFYDNHDGLETFGKELSFYDEKVKLFVDFLETID